MPSRSQEVENDNGFDREVVTIAVAAVPGLAMPNPTTLSTRRFSLSRLGMGGGSAPTKLALRCFSLGYSSDVRLD